MSFAPCQFKQHGKVDTRLGMHDRRSCAGEKRSGDAMISSMGAFSNSSVHGSTGFSTATPRLLHFKFCFRLTARPVTGVTISDTVETIA